MKQCGPLPHHIYTICLFHCIHFYGFAELCYDFNLHLPDNSYSLSLCLYLLIIRYLLLQRTCSQYFGAVLLGSLLL